MKYIVETIKNRIYMSLENNPNGSVEDTQFSSYLRNMKNSYLCFINVEMGNKLKFL